MGLIKKKKSKKLKSPIDGLIIDLILEHYNIQSLKGKKETLSANDFMEMVKIAESRYYIEMITDSTKGTA